MKNSLKEYSTRNLVVTNWKESLFDAFKTMRRAQVRHLPVVDDDGFIVGIVSDRDFQRAMQIDTADFFSALTPTPEFDPNSVVRDYMSWPVAAIEESSSIADAARTMIERKISALLVTRDGLVTGIVTTEDLLRTLLDQADSPSRDVLTGLRGALYDSPIGPLAYALANAGI